MLKQAGYKLIVVTNQSGVARGYFAESDLRPVQDRLWQLLSSADTEMTDFYYCPHHPQGEVAKYAVECSCRKPNPGMLYRAAREHDINLEESWLVGDILNDIEAGNRAGCRTVLVNNHNETEWELSLIRQPAFIVKDLKSAACIITLENQLKKILSYGEKERQLTTYH